MIRSHRNLWTEKAAKATSSRRKEQMVLKLYVSGSTPKSMKAIKNLKKICDDNLEGGYDLEIIDIYQQPILAKGEQIIAVPTLIKKLPWPLQTFIGDLSNTEKVLLGLNIVRKN